MAKPNSHASEELASDFKSLDSRSKVLKGCKCRLWPNGSQGAKVTVRGLGLAEEGACANIVDYTCGNGPAKAVKIDIRKRTGGDL